MIRPNDATSIYFPMIKKTHYNANNCFFLRFIILSLVKLYSFARSSIEIPNANFINSSVFISESSLFFHTF